MALPLLSRCALARVLQSLLTAELQAARGGVLREDERAHSPSGAWPEGLNIEGGESHSLGCDSLDVLGLAAATNEMFHLSEAGLDTEVFSATTFGAWLDIIEAAWRGGVVNISFRTSGSTGTPKRCTHPFSHLQTEVRYLADMFTTRERIVALAPAHHIYGFIFTAMLPDQLGLDVVPAGRTRQAGLCRSLQNGDLIVSIPEQWLFLDRTSARWPKGVDGVVSTAPCSRELIQSLMEKGLHGMTEVYGATETSGIGTRVWPEDGYRLMQHWHPTNSSDPQKTNLVHNSGMQVQLMDRIHFRGDGCFVLGGRLDGSVQVGGTNVSPARIAALLISRPGVGNAAVRLMRPEEGMRLKAFIVPEPETSQDIVRRELEGWIKTHLTAVERPQTLTFGPGMPTDSLDTALDW
jgi:long-chain acyl-CoA synthetase